MLEFYYLKTIEYVELVIITYSVPLEIVSVVLNNKTSREFINAGIDEDETRRLDHLGE